MGGFKNIKKTLLLKQQRYNSLRPKPSYFFDFVGFSERYLNLLRNLKFLRIQKKNMLVGVFIKKLVY